MSIRALHNIRNQQVHLLSSHRCRLQPHVARSNTLLMSLSLAVRSPWSMSLCDPTLSSLFWSQRPLRGLIARLFTLMASIALKTMTGGRAIRRALRHLLAFAAVTILGTLLTSPRWIIPLFVCRMLTGETTRCGRVRVACAPGGNGSLSPRVRRKIGPILIFVGGLFPNPVSRLRILTRPSSLKVTFNRPYRVQTSMSNRVVPGRRLCFPFSARLRHRSTTPCRASMRWNGPIIFDPHLWRPHLGKRVQSKCMTLLSLGPSPPPFHLRT